MGASDTLIRRITRLREALEKEKREDRERHRAMLEEYKLSERKEKGWTWHPVQIVETGYTFGDNAYVHIERKIEPEVRKGNQFRSGQPVRIYDAEEEEGGEETLGVIHFAKKSEIRILLFAEDPPDWLFGSSLAIEEIFDERTYRDMDRALTFATDARGRYLYLLEKLLGEKSHEPISLPEAGGHAFLNPSQVNAVEAILRTEDIAVVHGPPGTGKTTTLAEAISKLVERGERVLVCAPSNTAVDVLAANLHRKKVGALRIGNLSRVDDDLLGITLDGILDDHPGSKEVKRLKIEAAALRKKAGKYKRSFGPRERKERNSLYQEAREVKQWAKQLEKRLISEIVESARVICCTFVNAQHDMLRDVDFDYTVIDEAGQALDPGMLIPLERSQKWVMAGDPFQLPPTVKSKAAEKMGLGTNMIERWINSSRQSFLLNIQYRMHEKIMGFPNDYFYDGQLKADASVSDRTFGIAENAPLEFIDTAGCDFQEEKNQETKSTFNEGEAMILREHFLQLIHQFSNAGLPLPSIGIITPYRAQVHFLRDLFEEEEDLREYLSYITIDSVDGFQGGERPIIYLSLVRTNDEGEIGFLRDYRRMNVALTRAQQKLIVIGNSAHLGSDPFYRRWLEFVDHQGFYRSAWEFMNP